MYYSLVYSHLQYAIICWGNSSKTIKHKLQVKRNRNIKTRGGVEDTRLKAKDTKKIRGQGQGQSFRGQTLSRPRTGMLEAKAKDQGHKRKCPPRKKKIFKNFFQAIFQKKKGLHKKFSSHLHKKTFSKKFFKRSTKF